MELINLENVMNTLEAYAQKVRNLYQDKLIQDDKIASGKLLNSVEYQVVNNGVAYEVQLRLEDYWKYVEYGVQGEKNTTSPFKNAGWKAYPFILKWISVKPVIPRPFDNGRIPTPKQLAYLITRSIGKKGILPGDQLKDSIEEVNARYKDKLVFALHQDMDTIMKVLVGEIQGSRPGF